MWSQLSTKKRLVALPLLAILLVNVAFAGTALAAPRIWVSSADLERDATLVGESVGVELQMHNNGDGGAITVEIHANGTKIESKRVQVPADSDKKESIPITLEEPGRYKISTQDETAGVLTVTKFRAMSTENRDDGRTTRLRAGAVPAGEPLTATLSTADNQSLSLQRVTMTASGSSFNRSVATYAPADGASFSVPDSRSGSVIGAIEMDAISGVDTTSLRVSVDRDRIRESGGQSDGVRIYRKANGSYVPLETEQVATTESTIVYEASTNGGTQFVVGSLSPTFDVRSTKLGTNDATDGQQVVLTTTVANVGPIAGDYGAEMRVDGITVDRQNVSLQPGESKTVTLQHTVRSKGEYAVRLGEEDVGSVVLTSDSVSGTEQPSDAETGTSGDESSDKGLLDAEPSLPSIGDIGAIELAIGASIALVGGGLILLLRH